MTLVLPPQDHVGVLAHGLFDCDCVIVEELTAFPRLKLRPSNRGEKKCPVKNENFLIIRSEQSTCLVVEKLRKVVIGGAQVGLGTSSR